jgi:hypothetical protein
VRLHSLSGAEIRRRLNCDRICIRTGPFVLAVRTSIAALADAIATLYADFPVIDNCAFADFHVEVAPQNIWQRCVRRRAHMTVGGYAGEDPVRLRLTPAIFEWGLNYSIAHNVYNYLLLHGAIVEREGRAVVLLGRSGAGKSTLCAALTLAGWRLLSDELTLIVPNSVMAVPIARPISLKNESIDLIRTLAPDATFGPLMATARKGWMRHVRPPTPSVERMDEPARLSRFVFVRHEAGAALKWEPVSPARAFVRVVDQSFSYGVRGNAGFEHLTRLLDECPTSALTYGNVREAATSIDRHDFPDRC